MRTPSGRYGHAEPAGQQEQPRFGPLAEDAGAAAIRTRIDEVLAATDLPDPCNLQREFKPETIRSQLNLHLRQHGLKKDTDQCSSGTLQPIVIERPAFDHTFFFAQPPTLVARDEAAGTWTYDAPIERADFGSVPNKALANLMARRGYPSIEVTHYPNDESKLPAPTDAPVTRDTDRKWRR